MMIWLDAQPPPALATWIGATFGIERRALRDLELRDAEDEAIFKAARQADAVVMTKVRDFPMLLDRFGPPPRVLWLTCGNTTNARLRTILQATLPTALSLLDQGDALVEISDLPIVPDGLG